jgi:hypothetical protein
MEAEPKPLTPAQEHLFERIFRSTGAVLTDAMETGLLMAEQNPTERQHKTEYAASGLD